MGLIDLGAIIASIVAALGAWAATRAASKANVQNSTVSGRLDAERNAYERARAFDVDTIERQADEIEELRLDNERLREDLLAVRKRLAILENMLPQWERLLNERIEEDSDG